MIFVTGDMHADPGRFSMENFPEQKEMTRNDYMVICGDFGLLWDKEESKREKWWLDWLAEKSYTTLVVDGNHEDFTRLNTLPEEEWNGGRVHKVRENVIHLMRGEIFDLNGRLRISSVERGHMTSTALRTKAHWKKITLLRFCSRTIRYSRQNYSC